MPLKCLPKTNSPRDRSNLYIDEDIVDQYLALIEYNKNVKINPKFSNISNVNFENACIGDMTFYINIAQLCKINKFE